ncbi:MAG: AcrR family transcriptional regulator [Paracoccaceae bacterium]|jgi:AcrR family transcriptional regulator
MVMKGLEDVNTHAYGWGMEQTPRLTREDWLRAGFHALSDGGPSTLKAEPLARRMGTTKGSFYWHFPDVPGFQAAMLDHWEQRAFAEIVTYLEAEPSLPKRLRRLGQIAATLPGAEFGGVAIEAAIRAWARSDDIVNAAVQRIDARRLAYLRELLDGIGLSNPDFARIIYAGLIGLEDLSSRDGQPIESPLETLIDLILALE